MIQTWEYDHKTVLEILSNKYLHIIGWGSLYKGPPVWRYGKRIDNISILRRDRKIEAALCHDNVFEDPYYKIEVSRWSILEAISEIVADWNQQFSVEYEQAVVSSDVTHHYQLDEDGVLVGISYTFGVFE